jgi:GT2 family glycosyltransferase
MDSVDVVINYYWRPTHNRSSQVATWLSILTLKENSCVGDVVLVDGSPTPDSFIEGICDESDVRYIHTGRELAFAEGYNFGWKLLSGPYVALMANDIFPRQGTMDALLEWIKRPDVGCVTPFLTSADYPPQVASYVYNAVTCEPSAITLNLNVFKRSVLESIGGVDIAYNGCFNDVILVLKIREMGYRVILAGDTQVVHMGQMTIGQGSTYNKRKDMSRFSDEYSLYLAKHGKWKIKHWRWPLATSIWAAILWWISQNIPSVRLRKVFQRFTMRYEPRLTQYPARYGNRKGPL